VLARLLVDRQVCEQRLQNKKSIADFGRKGVNLCPNFHGRNFPIFGKPIIPACRQTSIWRYPANCFTVKISRTLDKLCNTWPNSYHPQMAGHLPLNDVDYKLKRQPLMVKATV